MPCIGDLWRAEDQPAMLRQQLSMTVEELQVMEEELQKAHDALAAMQSQQAAAANALRHYAYVIKTQVHRVRADAAAARERSATMTCNGSHGSALIARASASSSLNRALPVVLSPLA